MALDDVADELSISRSQPYALVRNGTLPAAKLGGRGHGLEEAACRHAAEPLSGAATVDCPAQLATAAGRLGTTFWLAARPGVAGWQFWQAPASTTAPGAMAWGTQPPENLRGGRRAGGAAPS